MHPTNFPEANKKFGPPSDLEDSQCGTIPAHVGEVLSGSVDGYIQVIVAWKPDPLDLQRLQDGGFVYLAMLGGLAPHTITTSFQESQNPR